MCKDYFIFFIIVNLSLHKLNRQTWSFVRASHAANVILSAIRMHKVSCALAAINALEACLENCHVTVMGENRRPRWKKLGAKCNYELDATS